MAEQKATRVRKKIDVTITISPYLKAKLDKMVESTDFSSISDLATIAFTEFITKYEMGESRPGLTQLSKNDHTHIKNDDDVEIYNRCDYKTD